ncbi:hypothetical protein [Moraxella sp. ZY210820]|uniref:hypothetical protein n=1 Tax=unclassified Moraxella TaxID=2685852 RepID=UPI002731955D|nr:hypothetical protein [Moraxella sp. ZY210820]WLF84539.1 hypothetical protein LU301_03430 [Moraxella sp. ZY210820]
MITDNELRVTGMQSLIHALGEVQAERFITLIRRDNFDYTEWQRTLFNECSDIEQFSQNAQDFFEKKMNRRGL